MCSYVGGVHCVCAGLHVCSCIWRPEVSFRWHSSGQYSFAFLKSFWDYNKIYHFSLLFLPPHTTPYSLSNSWPLLSLLLLVLLLLLLVCCILKPINTTFTIYMIVCIYVSGLTVWYWRLNCCFLPSQHSLVASSSLSMDVVLVQVLFKQTWWWDFLGEASDVTRRQNLTANMCQSCSSKNLFVLTSKMTSEPYV